MSDLHRLLRERHAGDFYVPECKTGATGSHRSLDGWALLPTWSPWTTIGYEIKATRSDWVRDQKYLEYRPYCHLLIVVANKGVVARQELPDGIGLLEPVGKGTGTRLVMRVKPSRQEPDPKKLVMLMSYVLMWRAREKAEYRLGTRETRVAMWRDWLDQKREFQAIGHRVKGRMRLMLTEALEAKGAAERQAERLSEAAAILSELGVSISGYRWNLRRDIEKALGSDAAETITDLDRAMERIAAIRNRVQAVSKPKAGAA